MLIRFCVATFLLVLALPAAAGEAPLSDWGGTGLLQGPVARMLPDGSVAAGFTRLGDLQRHLFVTAQPLPWLELTFRQTAYPNYYGLFEPGLDVKLRLVKEGELWPEIAIGGRDVAGSGFVLPGTGRFAGEYVVATRRWWDVDLTVGLGWGRFAGRNAVPNPLGWLGGRYARDRDPADTTVRGPRAWFTGQDAALFGGVAWRTPLPGLTLKLEYSADSFRAERQEDPAFRAGIPVNAGLSWRPVEWLEIGAGFEQGRRTMLRVATRLTPRLLADDPVDTPPPAVGAPPASTAQAADAVTLGRMARAEGLPLTAVEAAGDRAVAWLALSGPDGGPLARTVGRTARLLADGAPSEADAVTVVTGARGLDGLAVTLDRDGVARAANARGSAEELWRTAAIAPAATAGPAPGRSWGLEPVLRSTIDLSLSERGMAPVSRAYTDASIRLEPLSGLVLGAGVRAEAGDTLAWLDGSAIPAERPVRSDLPLYAEAGAGIEHAWVSWLDSPAEGWHARLSAGHFEEMFGGVSAELLRKPLLSRWALGLDVNRVWKRPPGGILRVDDDNVVTTGHLSAYLDGEGEEGWSGALRLGRYLGGDWGGTVELSRRWEGGIRLAAHMTWTDGPRPGQSPYAGRLEHGVALVVPLHALARMGIDAAVGGSVRTLGRDAGQRLEAPLPLHDTLDPAGFGRLAGTWRRLME
ncbi:YjbH domain-containing protein [Azospirillum oleiclasticum]|uniref:YjbH domain-containing protein n=1 Tax=Azospirillum oleiclasticum TaxID=2735135 RepID=UPI0031B5EC8E